MTEAIRGHQGPSGAIRGPQRPSEAIRGHQGSSDLPQRLVVDWVEEAELEAHVERVAERSIEHLMREVIRGDQR
jgi:hypothetical protein